MDELLKSYSQKIFLGIDINIYSHILAVAVLIILVLVIVHILGYLFSAKIREKAHQISHFFYIKIIGIFALLSTILALVYQYGYTLEVCELCWWQRIFMFPLELLVLATIIKKIKGNHLAIGFIAGFGTIIASYHYWLHFQSWVLGNDNVTSITSCSAGGILPSCVDPAGVVIFDFLTIPFMALSIFILILWLAFLASRSYDAKN